MEKNSDNMFRKEIDAHLFDIWAQVLNLQLEFTLNHERHLYTQFGIEKSQRIADVGCGTGYYTRFLKKWLAQSNFILGFDIQEKFIQYAQKNNTVSGIEYQCNAFDGISGLFDLITARLLVQHLPDPQAFFNWASSCISSGGHLVVIEPYDEMEYFSERMVNYKKFRLNLRKATCNGHGNREVCKEIKDYMTKNHFDIIWDNIIVIPAIGKLKKIIYKAKTLVPKLNLFPLTDKEKSLYTGDLDSWFNKSSSYAHIALKTVVGRRI